MKPITQNFDSGVIRGSVEIVDGNIFLKVKDFDKMSEEINPAYRLHEDGSIEIMEFSICARR